MLARQSHRPRHIWKRPNSDLGTEHSRHHPYDDACRHQSIPRPTQQSVSNASTATTPESPSRTDNTLRPTTPLANRRCHREIVSGKHPKVARRN
eukprot:scaffold4494_cov161-Amphora_coffeaeformis.AAC.6